MNFLRLLENLVKQAASREEYVVQLAVQAIGNAINSPVASSRAKYH